MVLVDTSAWIEWLIESETAELLRPHIPDEGSLLMPTIVQLELAKWLTRTVGQGRADEVIAYTQLCHVVMLDSETAFKAADLCRSAKLATADAIVYATARIHRADLLTCDAHFRDLPAVSYVAKAFA